MNDFLHEMSNLMHCMLLLVISNVILADVSESGGIMIFFQYMRSSSIKNLSLESTLRY